MDAIAEAHDWLNNTSDYEKGLNILNSLGCDAFTFALLSSGADNFNRETLYSEISLKLANNHISGLGENKSANQIATEIVTSKIIADIKQELADKGAVPLDTSILDVIKNEQTKLMDERAELKAQLRYIAQDANKQVERKALAFAILEISEKLNIVEADKDFFLQFGYLPSGLPEPEDNPVDLLKRQGTLRTYIVRYSKPGKNPDKLIEYQEELAIVDAKLKKYAV